MMNMLQCNQEKIEFKVSQYNSSEWNKLNNETANIDDVVRLNYFNYPSNNYPQSAGDLLKYLENKGADYANNQDFDNARECFVKMIYLMKNYKCIHLAKGFYYFSEKKLKQNFLSNAYYNAGLMSAKLGHNGLAISYFLKCEISQDELVQIIKPLLKTFKEKDIKQLPIMYQKKILSIIDRFPINERLEFYREALDNTTPLGKYFWKNSNLEKGALKDINNSYKNIKDTCKQSQNLLLRKLADKSKTSYISVLTNYASKKERVKKQVESEGFSNFFSKSKSLYNEYIHDFTLADQISVANKIRTAMENSIRTGLPSKVADLTAGELRAAQKGELSEILNRIKLDNSIDITKKVVDEPDNKIRNAL